MSVLVIIPTYNERDNITMLVPAVLAHGYQVMIVDDDSPDGTGEVADTLAARWPGRVTVIHRTGDRGLGRSYLEALRERSGPMPTSSVRWTPTFLTTPRIYRSSSP